MIRIAKFSKDKNFNRFTLKCIKLTSVVKIIMGETENKDDNIHRWRSQLKLQEKIYGNKKLEKNGQSESYGRCSMTTKKEVGEKKKDIMKKKQE